MVNDELASLVLQIVESCAPEPSRAPTVDLLLVDDLGYDSLALIELATDLAVAFETEPIGEEQLSDVSTMGDVVTLIAGLLA